MNLLSNTYFFINTDFLNEDFTKWGNNENYQKARLLVKKNIFVTNDKAERVIKLIKDYNTNAKDKS